MWWLGKIAKYERKPLPLQAVLRLFLLLVVSLASNQNASGQSQVNESQPSLPQDLQQLTGGALDGTRPRIIVSTDIGGSDPDDFQSMVHLLMYADVFDIEGLISSPPDKGRLKDILEAIDAYEKDFETLRKNSGREFTSPESLRRRSVQGAISAAPKEGWSKASDGSRLIVQQAKVDDERPLWVLVWGSMTDVAQALHDDPTIRERLRVYSIGSWNTRQDQAARDYVFNEHCDLWWIECDTSFRGMYMGGKQDEEWGNRTFVELNVREFGELGKLFWNQKRDIKMGDTPSVLYLLRGNPDDPTSDHWGGSFQATDHGPNYWTDDPNRELEEQKRTGAKTVNCWRIEYLSDWKQRMRWLKTK